MDEVERFRSLSLFDGKNFNDWKFRLRSHLDELELLIHIDTPLKDLLEPVQVSVSDNATQKKAKGAQQKIIIQNDKKCKNIIFNRIHNCQLELVKDKETAYDVWNALRDRFEAKHTTARVNHGTAPIEVQPTTGDFSRLLPEV